MVGWLVNLVRLMDVSSLVVCECIVVLVWFCWFSMGSIMFFSVLKVVMRWWYWKMKLILCLCSCVRFVLLSVVVFWFWMMRWLVVGWLSRLMRLSSVFLFEFEGFIIV